MREAQYSSATKALSTSAGMLPALVDRQGAPSLDLSQWVTDAALLKLFVERGLFDGLDTRNELTEECGARLPCEMGAQAKMLADPESQVRIRMTIDPECVGFLEDILIAIC